MAIIRVTDALATTIVTAVKDALDAGAGPATIKIYTTPMPATAGTAITSQTLLGTLTCADPCGSVSGRVPTFGSISSDTSADATGTAVWARLATSAGTTVCDLDITVTGGGGALTLDRTGILETATIAVTSLTVQI